MLIPTLLLAALPQGPQTWAPLERTHLPADLGAFTGSAVADLDADGDADLLAVGSRSTRLLLNDGKARFADAPAGTLPAGLRLQSDPAIADFDGDGDPDIVATTSSNTFSLLRNQGGRFVLVASFPSGSAQSPAAADLDSDGDLDLVVRERNRVAVFLNDGTGRFTDGGPRGLPILASVRSVDVGDVDADGDVDVLVGNLLVTGGARLFLNDGAAGFTVAAAFPLRSTDRMRFGDLDADGDLDILAHDALGQGSDDRLTVLRNDGSGGYTDIGGGGLPGIRLSETFTLGDFDGDADLDVVRLGFRSSILARNDGRGRFPATAQRDLDASVRELISATAVDLDGDLDLDLVGSSVLRGHLLLNLDRGAFTPAVTRGLPTNRLFTRDARLADLDRDGDPDLFAWNSTTPNAALLRNRGGTFELDPRFPELGDDVRGAVFDDLNGDGAADLYLCFGFGSDAQDRLFLNRRGSLLEVTGQALPQQPDRTWAPFAADLDGDGHTDLVMRRSTAPRLRILLQRPDGTFSAGGSAVGLPTQFSLLAVGDIDGDQAPDLLTTVGVFRNDGTAVFTAAPGLAPPFGAVVFAALLEDFDQDGDLDAYIARTGFGSAGGQDLMLENQGGTLVDVTLGKLPIALDQTTRVFAADLDADGDLDVYGRLNSGPKFLRNDGGLAFSPMPVNTSTALQFEAFAAADTDRDGDVDLVTIDRIDRNLGSQIHAPFLAQVGAGWAVDCYSSAGPRSAVLLLSPRAARIDLPGLGTLGLDLSLAYDLGSVAVAGDGSPTRLTTPVPALASLIGQGFLAQAAFVDAQGSGRLSNVLREILH